jgi:hypothetical protein
MFGGGQEISLSGAERVRDWTLADQGRATTFGGCRFARRKREIVVGREAARFMMAVMVNADPGPLIWDDRYEIASFRLHMLPATVVPARDCTWTGKAFGRARFRLARAAGGMLVKGAFSRRLAPPGR